MINRVIHEAIHHRVFVILVCLIVGGWGTWAITTTPIDALPDLSDAQVTVRTPFPGQAPALVENQVTYPLASKMLSVPGASSVRGYSLYGDSFVYILFEEGTDLYWARARMLEALSQVHTYNGYIRYMRLVMDYAISRGYTQNNDNIFKTIRLAPVGEISRKVMKMDVIDTACRHISQNAHEYRPHWFWLTVIYILYYTGMRRRQLVSLKLKDIDFETSHITLSYDGSKTHRSWVIPMHETVNARLRDLVLRSEAALGRKLKGSDLFFCW